MLNYRIGDLEQLRDALRAADKFLAGQASGRLWSEVSAELSRMDLSPVGADSRACTRNDGVPK